MSQILREKCEEGCIECLLHVPSTLSKTSKRWHLAFVAIYCSRTFLSLSSLAKKNEKNTNILFLRSSSYSVISFDSSDNGFSKIDQASLIDLVKNKNVDNLQNLGGVEGLASALQTNTQNGILSGEEIALRQQAFGSNTYKNPPTKSLFHFVVEAFKDLTILILMGCAALSLGFGIKEHGLKEGWYDGGSIFVAVFLVIAVSAGSNFRQNRQFDKLSRVSNNIQIEVVRSGRRQQISIFEIVVGDVVCLKIGDQVPADGVFIDGQSLQIDESSMTGESDHVEVNSSHNPFWI